MDHGVSHPSCHELVVTLVFRIGPYLSDIGLQLGYLKIWNQGCKKEKKNQIIEKIAFKVVQMKFLAMHNQKLSFDIFTVGNFQNIFIEHLYLGLMIFGIKEKNDNFDPYDVLLATATNIPVLLKTGFVVQGHK